MARNSETGPEVGDRVAYRCPFCGKEDSARYRLSRCGVTEWFVKCPKSGCDGQHLPALAVELGLDSAADKDEIVTALATRSPVRRALTPPPLPSEACVRSMATRLRRRDGREGRRYLSERGVSRRQWRRHQIGWNGTFLVFPMRDRTGHLAAFKTRLPRDGAPIRKPGGSGAWSWPLYPLPEPEWRSVLLVEGEIDALRLRSVGVPATSVTGGVDHWRDEWVDDLRGLRVVVAFDVEFEGVAADRADRLRAGGIKARAFDLRRLGLSERNEDLSDYLNRGGDPDVLRRLLAARIVRRRSTT